MEYTTLGKTGQTVSRIGLGTEYLINTPRANVVSVVKTALDAGVNYIDLFFAQPELRENIGIAIQGGRDKIMIAGHLGAAEKKGQYWRTRNLKISETYIHDLLNKLKIDYIDVLFLHNCDKENDFIKVMGDFFNLAKRFVHEGKARFLGFSNHAVPLAHKAIAHDEIDILLFPVNMAGASADAQGLFRACAARNTGLIAMKAFGGGKLLKKETAGVVISLIQCLNFALSQPGVHCVVPGPKNVSEFSEILRYFKTSPHEKDYARVLQELKTGVQGECVYCNHCLPCPAAIDIGATIRAIETRTGNIADAASCTACGACVERCPFGVDVIAIMKSGQR